MTEGGASLKAVRCDGCGGTIRAREGSLPACLFCGAPAADLRPYDQPESIEDPVGAIPFAIQDAEAREAFVKFASSSFWYPSDLRSTRLELRRLLVPAWAWSGALETHWTGLKKARTASGKRPLAGSAQIRFEQVLVPASQTLTLSELRRLGAYDESALGPFHADANDDPWELSELTRSAARQKAQTEMEERHRRALEAEHELLSCKVASIAHELDGKPVLVPVFIGSYRYGDGLYRILVNGQTGQLVGEAPTSWWKVLGAVLLALFVLATVAFAVMICVGGTGGALALLGSL